jgi:hypothetical protein
VTCESSRSICADGTVRCLETPVFMRCSDMLSHAEDCLVLSFCPSEQEMRLKMEKPNQAFFLKNGAFWDVARRGFIINRHFGETCRLHFQGRRNNTSEEKC